MLPGILPVQGARLRASGASPSTTPPASPRSSPIRTAGIDRVIRRLLPGGGQLLLVVDQFEELFTLATERGSAGLPRRPDPRRPAPDSRLRVVATLRADFYDRPLAFQRFGAAVNGATVTISAMSPAELEAAVVEPAERVGGQVERALVAELVERGRRRARGAPVAAVRAVRAGRTKPGQAPHDGRLPGAGRGRRGDRLAGRAALPLARRRRARRRSGRCSSGSSSSAPRASRRAAASPAPSFPSLLTDRSVDATIDRWAQARLLTLDRHPQTRVPTVELAHEALLREWPRLRRWIEEDREAIVVLGHLREAAASWVELGRDPGALVPWGPTAGRARGRRRPRRRAAGGGAGVPRRQPRRTRPRAAGRDRAHRPPGAGQPPAPHPARRHRRRPRRRPRRRLHRRRPATRTREHERRVATARELAAAADASLADDPDRSILLALAADRRDPVQATGRPCPKPRPRCTAP